MSYQALLFCPDEKTARVVSQVLSELEFSVVPSHEPFSAVKTMMVGHFDAVVVDCDNEQNAALLFKSAKSSGSNQSALAVAVVEGQAGVAKAFRLGANLVLTKPIHLEQSKATLRVARSLLRKGKTAKAAGTGATPEASPALPPARAPLAAPQSSAPPPAASASAFELDAEPSPPPDPADAALLEYMPDSVPSPTQVSPPPTADSGGAKKYAWQPRSSMAEPMASALRRAAEAAGHMEFGTPPTGAQLTSPASSGAASAPARAPEAPLAGSKAIAAHPAITSAPQRGRQSQEPELDQASISGATLEPEESHFPAFGQDAEEEVSGGGGSKKILFAAVLLLGAAAAAYVGWNRMEATHPQPAAPPLLPAQPATVVPPPEPAAVAGESQPQDNQITAAPGDASELVVTPSSSKPTAALPTEAAGGKASALPKTGSEANEISAIPAPPAAPAESSPPLVVSKGASVRPKSEAETSEPESAPSPTTIATATDSRALSGLVNTNAAAVAHSAQQPRKISQGVSQGLLIKKIQPTYSPQARQLRLEGKVELQANISKTGNITEVKQVSGDPILGRSAMDAVKQWKYKPYFLNGEPIEIQTQITVNFKLP